VSAFLSENAGALLGGNAGARARVFPHKTSIPPGGRGRPRSENQESENPHALLIDYS
jgi:hypothetical protein